MTTSQLNMEAQATSEMPVIPNTPQTTDNVQRHIGIIINQPQSHTPREPNTRYKNLTSILQHIS